MRINKSALMWILTSIVLLQCFIFIFVTFNHQKINNAYYRKILIQQIIVLVQRAQGTTTPQKIVDKTHLPDTNLTLTHDAEEKTQFTKESLWDIYNKINLQEDIIHISVKLKNNQWLNIISDIHHPLPITQKYLIILDIFITIFILILFFALNRLTISLYEIKDAAFKFGLDQNATPLTLSGPTLVRQTFSALNEMQQRIKALIQERTYMIAAISHDLRTPITRMRLRAEELEKIDQQQKYMQDLDEMEAMIKETLNFAKEDYQQQSKNPLDLTALLISVVNDFIDAGHSVKYDGDETSHIVFGSALALKRAFRNIIDNAVKYAGSVNINLKVNNHLLTITLIDNGLGLTDEQIQQIFTPFYRGNTSRSRKTGGTGLGLTIARNIILAHKGELLVTRAEPHGLRVEIKLPSS